MLMDFSRKCDCNISWWTWRHGWLLGRRSWSGRCVNWSLYCLLFKRLVAVFTYSETITIFSFYDAVQSYQNNFLQIFFTRFSDTDILLHFEALKYHKFFSLYSITSALGMNVLLDTYCSFFLWLFAELYFDFFEQSLPCIQWKSVCTLLSPRNYTLKKYW